MPLEPFGTSSPKTFRAHLDRTTADMQKCLPRSARSWGVTRKLLNIFLRNAMYNRYLEEAFHLSRAEHLFEVPLDSIIAKELVDGIGLSELSPWPGVKYVTRPLSDEYQEAIRTLAASEGLAPIHLDTYWWGGAR